jgi:hypothetical protein
MSPRCFFYATFEDGVVISTPTTFHNGEPSIERAKFFARLAYKRRTGKPAPAIVIAQFKTGPKLNQSVLKVCSAAELRDGMPELEHGKIEDANVLVRRNSKPRPCIEAPLGLNAIGKPYGANYDPSYKLRHKPSYGHLRAPYPTTMRFVGDPPRADAPRTLRLKRLQPVPLLKDYDPLLEHVAKMQAAAQAQIKAQTRALKSLKAHLDAAQKIFERPDLYQGSSEAERDMIQANRDSETVTNDFSPTPFMRDVLRARGIPNDLIAQLTVEQIAAAFAGAEPKHLAVATERAAQSA